MVWIQKRSQTTQVVFPLWEILFLKSLDILRWGLKIKPCQDQVIYINHGKYFNVNYNKVGLHCNIKDVLWSYGSFKQTYNILRKFNKIYEKIVKQYVRAKFVGFKYDLKNIHIIFIKMMYFSLVMSWFYN